VKGRTATGPPSRVEGQLPQNLTLSIKGKRHCTWASGQEEEVGEQIS
jgi:hypothetical protein